MPKMTTPFHQKRFQSVTDAYQHGFNEHYWRHGIVISQGNRMSVSLDDALRRFDKIRRYLSRKMFGNGWRKKGKINMVIFQHGSRDTCDAHFHGLLGIEGDHGWSVFRIAMTIRSRELMLKMRQRTLGWEKMAHVDWNWEKGNRYHSYISRFANKRPDDLYVI